MSGDYDTYEKDGWVYADHVAVFDEHERDGVVFDEARLQKIAENCNRRIADTGDLVPLIPGHVPSDKPEEMTEVLGWAGNFNIGDWGRDNPRKAIFADLKFEKDKWAKAKELPRRSIELWDFASDQAFIDPIALLGASTPERDLGLLYAKKSSTKNTYTYTLTGGMMEKDELAKFVAECMANSDMGKFVKAQMDKASAESEEEAEKNDAEDSEGEEKKMESAEDDVKDDDGEDKEKLKNQRDQERRKFARLENEHRFLASRLAEVERRERVSTRKADLLGLEGEGILFDMSEELDNVADLTAAGYVKHLDVMRKRYSKAPIGVKVPVAPMAEYGRGATVEPTREEVRKAADLLTSGRAKNSEEAFSMVKGGK